MKKKLSKKEKTKLRNIKNNLMKKGYSEKYALKSALKYVYMEKGNKEKEKRGLFYYLK
ncbi:MAG: hypothetical protein ACP5LA_07275 [Thermoplasmata archaeon]